MVSTSRFLTLVEATTIVERAREAMGDRVPTLSDCDQGKMSSALAAPQWSYKYPFLVDQAACLMYHLIKDHACPDGNKRIGVILTASFLGINGHEFKPGTESELRDRALEVASSAAEDRSVSVAQLALWISKNIAPIGVRFSEKPREEG